MSLFERMVVWADELPWGDPVFVIYATGAGSALLVAGGASFGGRSRRSAGVAACISATGTWALGLGLLGWTQAIAVGPDGPQGHGSIEVSPFDQIVVARFVAKTLAAVTLATMVPLYRAWGVRAAVTAMLLVSACGGTLHAMAEWDLQFSLWGMDGTVPPAGARWESAREAVVLMGSVVSAFVAVTRHDRTWRSREVRWLSRCSRWEAGWGCISPRVLITTTRGIPFRVMVFWRLDRRRCIPWAPRVSP